MSVVVPMNGRPPQDASLSAHLPHEGEHELKRSTRLVRAVREVPMEPGCERPHADQVERHAHDDRRRREARPEDPEGRDVDQGEGNRLRIYDVVVGLLVSASARIGLGPGLCLQRHFATS